jgi:hypothetical protein
MMRKTCGLNGGSDCHVKYVTRIQKSTLLERNILVGNNLPCLLVLIVEPEYDLFHDMYASHEASCYCLLLMLHSLVFIL